MPAMFIRVDLDPAIQSNAEACKKLAEVCPVDIFRVDDEGHVQTVEEHLDECTLCDLCIQAAPPHYVNVVKLYRE